MDHEYKDKLIKEYAGFVKHFVDIIKPYTPSYITYEELHDAGLNGLVFAVEHYKPNGLRDFESYAITLIKNEILNATRELQKEYKHNNKTSFHSLILDKIKPISLNNEMKTLSPSEMNKNLIVLEGNLEYKIDNKITTLNQSDFMHIPKCKKVQLFGTARVIILEANHIHC